MREENAVVAVSCRSGEESSVGKLAARNRVWTRLVAWRKNLSGWRERVLKNQCNA